MKGDLITQMFEENGIKVVDVTPKARDWQFRPMRDGETFAIFTGKPSKRIPIEMWEELKYDSDGISQMVQYTLKSELRNQSGKTYLVTIKE